MLTAAMGVNPIAAVIVLPCYLNLVTLKDILKSEWFEFAAHLKVLSLVNL